MTTSRMTSDEPTGVAPSSVKSADRALAIIGYVADRGSARFNDIVGELGIPRSSSHALLQTLVNRNWLDFDPETRRYSVGLQAWHVGKTYTGNGDLVAVARPVMDKLAEDLVETVQLARLDGMENVYIAISEANRPMRLASTVGARLYAHATGIGKALLAQLPAEEAGRRIRSLTLPRFTDQTVTDPNELDLILSQVRTNGYALDDEELLLGCRCVAVPLMDDGNGMLTALSATTTTAWADSNWPFAELEQLRVAAGIIRARMGSVR